MKSTTKILGVGALLTAAIGAGCAATPQETYGTASLTCPDETRYYELRPSTTIWNRLINSGFSPIPCTLEVKPINALCEMQVAYNVTDLGGNSDLRTGREQLSTDVQFQVNSELFRGTLDQPRVLENISLVCGPLPATSNNLQVTNEFAMNLEGLESGRKFVATQITGTEQLDGILRQINGELNGTETAETRKRMTIPGKIKVIIDPLNKQIVGLRLRYKQNNRQFTDVTFGVVYNQNEEPGISGALIEEFYRARDERSTVDVSELEAIKADTKVRTNRARDGADPQKVLGQRQSFTGRRNC